MKTQLNNKKLEIIMEDTEIPTFLRMCRLAEENRKTILEENDCKEYFRSIRNQIDRTISKGKIQIYASDTNNLVAEIDGYKDNQNIVLKEWGKQFEVLREGSHYCYVKWFMVLEHQRKLEVRTLARKNQAYYSNNYKVVATYYYKII